MTTQTPPICTKCGGRTFPDRDKDEWYCLSCGAVFYIGGIPQLDDAPASYRRPKTGGVTL